VAPAKTAATRVFPSSELRDSEERRDHQARDRSPSRCFPRVQTVRQGAGDRRDDRAAATVGSAPPLSRGRWSPRSVARQRRAHRFLPKPETIPGVGSQPHNHSSSARREFAQSGLNSCSIVCGSVRPTTASGPYYRLPFCGVRDSAVASRSSGETAVWDVGSMFGHPAKDDEKRPTSQV
jgi:hypothetical protein